VISPLLTISDAAKFLQYSQDTVRRYAKAGKIPHIRIGRRTLFTEEGLLRFVDSCRVEPEAPTPRAQGRVVAGKVKSDEYYLRRRQPQ
jgi:excisionase family DNA binding protein